MARAFIAGVAFAFCAYPVLAQDHSNATIAVIVVDQAHVRIPAAHITVAPLAAGAWYEATTDASGQAVLYLVNGRYALRVQAGGCATWPITDFEVNAEIQRTVTLEVDRPCSCHGDRIDVDEDFEIPLQHQPLASEIPLIPMQQFVPPAKPIRHKRHWFWF